MEKVIKILAFRIARFFTKAEKVIYECYKNFLSKKNKLNISYIKEIINQVNENKKIIFTDDFVTAFYVWQGVLGDLSKFAIILILSYFMSLLMPCLIVMFSFATLRFLLGGYHGETFESCFIITALLFLGGAYLANILSNYEFNSKTTLLLNIILLTITILYSPRFMVKMSKKKIQKYKVCAIIYIIFLCTISYVMNLQIKLSIYMGLAVQVFTITPTGYFFLHKIEKIINYKDVEK